jgi:glycosyltransferase involved in cell wall biosynthesis
MTKRVVVVFPQTLSYQDGAGRRALLAIDALEELGYRLTILTTKEGVRLPKDSAKIELDSYQTEYHRSITREMGKELYLLRKHFLKIFTNILREKSDIVQIHGATRAVPIIAALLGAKLAGSRIIYFLDDLIPDTATLMRGLSSDSLSYGLLKVFEKVVCSSSNRIIVVSDTMKDVLLGRYGERFAERIHVIPPYVDIEKVVGSNMKRHSPKSGVIPRGGLVIFYVGKLEPRIRGLEGLIAGFGKLVVKGKTDAHLLLIGDGSARNELERMAAEQGIEDRVVFTGNVSHEDVVKLMQEGDIAVIPYPKSVETHIAVPTKVVEYMAAGKTIVTSRLVQIKRILGKNAIYYDPENTDSLLGALEEAVMSIHKGEKIGRTLQEKAAMFKKEVVKGKLKELYMSF